MENDSFTTSSVGKAQNKISETVCVKNVIGSRGVWIFPINSSFRDSAIWDSTKCDSANWYSAKWEDTDQKMM